MSTKLEDNYPYIEHWITCMDGTIEIGYGGVNNSHVRASDDSGYILAEEFFDYTHNPHLVDFMKDLENGLRIWYEKTGNSIETRDY